MALLLVEAAYVRVVCDACRTASAEVCGKRDPPVMARVAAMRQFKARLAPRPGEPPRQRAVREGVGGQRVGAVVLPDVRSEDPPLIPIEKSTGAMSDRSSASAMLGLMDMPEQQIVVPALLQPILASIYPPQVREEIERELPTISLQAIQLGLEVMAAEHRGIRFAEAVVRPEFLKMGRIYFGATNLLQWRVPPSLRGVIEEMLDYAAEGGFDPTRRLIFAIATRKTDPEAALCRFLLWAAVRLNLLVLSWHSPEVELLGSLDEMDEKAEHVLRDLLEVSDMHDLDTRPLHVLMTEMAVRLSLSVKARFAIAMREFGGELNELMSNCEALEKVRALEARPAAMLWPGRNDCPIGSQQVVDRYPQHFRLSANAMEQQRSRLLAKLPAVEVANDRVIDFIFARTGGAW